MADDFTAQDDAPSSNGRSAQFQEGVAGGGLIASALPAVTQASRDFDPTSSVLLAANQYSGLGNASSDSTLKVSNPYGLSMRNSIRQGNDGKSEE